MKRSTSNRDIAKCLPINTTHPLFSKAHFIITKLQENGYKAYIVGGAVRDLIMNKVPNEVDIATDASPDAIESLFPNTQAVGKSFGVIIVCHQGKHFEVATFRKDGPYHDHRHPSSVSSGTIEEDISRRDFTINALMADLNNGSIIDLKGGLEDIHHKLIRAIGHPEDRFQEDALRLLRAIRFATVLDFEIEPSTFKVIKQLAPSITHVSAERIRDEITKILTSATPGRGLTLLRETELLHYIFPEVTRMIGIPQPQAFHPEGDVYTHVHLMMGMLCRPSITLAMGVLLHDIGKPDTFEMTDRIRFNNHPNRGAEISETILKRLRFSNKAVDRIVSLVKNHMKFMHVQEMREATLKRFILQDNFDEHLELHRVDCMASHKKLENYTFIKEKQKSFDAIQALPRPIITGHDLIRAGLAPGKSFKTILTHLMDLQLEGKITTQSEGLAELHRFIKKAKLPVSKI